MTNATNNPMPAFKCYKNRAFVGMVSAVSLAQAQRRAVALYGRCEVIAQGERRMAQKDIHRDAYTHGKRPYATPGFEERRAALIAAHKAQNA